MRSKLLGMAGVGLCLLALWILINPFGVTGLPWGWGEARVKTQGGCSYAVIHVRRTSIEIRAMPPARVESELLQLPVAAAGPIEGAPALNAPVVRLDNGDLLFDGPAGNYVWDTVATLKPCAGSFAVVAGRRTVTNAGAQHLPILA